MLSDLENLEKEKIKTYNTENDYFNQRLECAAPKRWSKFTTLLTPGLSVGLYLK